VSGVSDYLENQLLDHLLGRTTYTAPATVYVGLWSVALSDASTGSTAGEVSGGGYSRVAVTNDTNQWPAASGGLKANASSVVFPSATSNWGTVRTVAILDAPSAGNLLFFATPAPVVSVAALDTLIFSPGDLSLRLD
jgi:hypothetical protein